MRVLIAEDEAVSRRSLEGMLEGWGHEVVICTDGAEALENLRREDSPRLAILDWMMPGLDGVEVCRRIRQTPDPKFLYIILLTSKGRREDVIEGLEAGADDYVSKPFHGPELRARVNVGVRMLDLQQSLTDRLQENANLDLLNKAACALAHHIRNAITPIIGMAQMFDPGDSDDGQFLKDVSLDEGRRIAAVIDALIEMSSTGVVPSVVYTEKTGPMLDMEPLIQQYLKQGPRSMGNASRKMPSGTRPGPEESA